MHPCERSHEVGLASVRGQPDALKLRPRPEDQPDVGLLRLDDPGHSAAGGTDHDVAAAADATDRIGSDRIGSDRHATLRARKRSAYIEITRNDQQHHALQRVANEHRGQPSRRYQNESNVKLDLSQLVDALGYGPVENEHTIPGGSIDIYIPHHRVIIETKARGLADDPHKPQAGDRESPKEQLDRYVLSEIRKELGSFEWDPENRSTQPWTGVVTDGRVWHAWRIPARSEPRD